MGQNVTVRTSLLGKRQKGPVPALVCEQLFKGYSGFQISHKTEVLDSKLSLGQYITGEKIGNYGIKHTIREINIYVAVTYSSKLLYDILQLHHNIQGVILLNVL